MAGHWVNYWKVIPCSADKQNMLMPNEYKTGNKKMDEKIEKALLKYPHKTNRLQDIMEIETIKEKGNPRITVSDKELRTYKDGTLFASAGEMKRWDDLLKVQAAGEIGHLRRQVEFLLQEGFTHPQWGEVKPLIYVSDFCYFNYTFRKEYPNRKCIEDSKGGYLTDVYKIKRKLFLLRYRKYLFFEV